MKRVWRDKEGERKWRNLRKKRNVCKKLERLTIFPAVGQVGMAVEGLRSFFPSCFLLALKFILWSWITPCCLFSNVFVKVRLVMSSSYYWDG